MQSLFVQCCRCRPRTLSPMRSKRTSKVGANGLTKAWTMTRRPGKRVNGNGSPAADEPTRVSVGLLPACWRISRSRHRSGITESSAILTIAEGASGENGLNVSASRHLAQFDVYYYAYGFDTGLEEVYYWYPAEDVIVTDIWIAYVPV